MVKWHVHIDQIRIWNSRKHLMVLQIHVLHGIQFYHHKLLQMKHRRTEFHDLNIMQ
ncbi:hypothetical protein AAUPMB_13855 [Pasteurella multocida subsp. multocida str. Anand1_buffalo]|nr:hypothetical protein AAUPMB_13855 [Pasteurella multocida subsp. multocida str. Anand1_buffalo]